MPRNRGWLIRLYYEHVKDAIYTSKKIHVKKKVPVTKPMVMALPLGYVEIHIILA